MDIVKKIVQVRDRRQRPEITVYFIRDVDESATAVVVVEVICPGTYRDSGAALFTVSPEGFGVTECPEDAFHAVEAELGYIPDAFMYTAAWLDALTLIARHGTADTVLDEAARFVSRMASVTFPDSPVPDAENICSRVKEHMKTTDAGIPERDFILTAETVRAERRSYPAKS